MSLARANHRPIASHQRGSAWRSRFGKTATALALVLSLTAVPAAWAADNAPAFYEQSVAGLTRQDGLMPVFVDGGRAVLLPLPAAGADGVMGG